jgi:solute carrier family 35 protein C2
MGMDIGLSNLSLVYVTVSFYTLAKTTSILFLLAFAFWLRLEPVSLRLTAAALTLTLGEVLTVQGETQFNALGFFLVIAAAACSGLRWVLSQRVLHAKNGLEGTGLRRSHGMHNPPAMLRTMMPTMCVVVFVFSCFQEDWWDTVPGSPWLDDPSDLLVDGGITLLGAVMAFCMSMAEFELLKETSAVTVMVIGTAKDVVTVACSILIFGDVFGLENFFGMCFVLAGIAAYNYHKAMCAREEREAEEVALATEMVIMGNKSGLANGVGGVGGVSTNGGAANGGYVPMVTMRKFGSSTPRLATRPIEP